MKHQLHPLPFHRNALEPFISAETIDYHYGKHHKGYVDKLNTLIPGTPFEEMSLIEIVKASNGAIFHKAGQVWNHDFYWQSLTPRQMTPGMHLQGVIDKAFLGFDSFKEKFRKAASEVFGSGWAWLVVDRDGVVRIETTQGADTPVRHGKTPLLTLDVWEHAYYIDYRNERARYLESAVNILNWDFAERGYANTLLSATG